MKQDGVWNEIKKGLQKTYLPRNDVLTMVFFQAYGKREALAIVARSEL